MLQQKFQDKKSSQGEKIHFMKLFLTVKKNQGEYLVFFIRESFNFQPNP